MARPRAHTHAIPTRERILRSAAEAFARDGLAHATLASIAAGASIRRPSLLYHFPSKDALYEAVVSRAFEDLGNQLSGVMSAPLPFRDRVVGMAVALQRFLASHPTHGPILVRELVNEGPGQQILVEQVAPLLDVVTTFLVDQGADVLRPELPVRAAVLQVVSSLLLHAAAPARDQLWGEPVPIEPLVRTLFFRPCEEA